MLRQAEKTIVLTFHTTAGAMAMEKLCKQNNIDGRLIPVPRCLSASCGIAWSMKPENKEALKRAIDGTDAQIASWNEILI